MRLVFYIVLPHEEQGQRKFYLCRGDSQDYAGFHAHEASLC